MNLRRNGLNDVIGRDTARSVGKLAFAGITALFLLYLISLLPGIERLIPGTSLSFMALIGAIVTLAVAGILLYLASTLAGITRLVLEGPKEVVEHLSSIVHWLMVLAAVLVAHRGLEPAVSSVLAGGAPYDIAFLLLALPPLVIIAARLYALLDPAADLFADKVAGE